MTFEFNGPMKQVWVLGLIVNYCVQFQAWVLDFVLLTVKKKMADTFLDHNSCAPFLQIMSSTGLAI